MFQEQRHWYNTISWPKKNNNGPSLWSKSTGNCKVHFFEGNSVQIIFDIEDL